MGALETQSNAAGTSRRYSAEQKKHAVRMVFALREELGTSSGTVARVARQLGYGEESLRRWVAQAEIDAGSRAGVSTAESEELKRLRPENRELRRANRISLRAAGFSGRSSTADSDDRAVHRPQPRRVRGRARLCSVAGGPFHVLGCEASSAVGACVARRQADAVAVGVVAGQLLGVSGAGESMRA